jgi:alanine dehydrogenase
MANRARPVTFGLPRMHKETGERRDFLPALVEGLVAAGAEVFVESSIGSGMGLTDGDYTGIAPHVHAVSFDEAYRQDVVLVLRCPDDFKRLRSGATLVSMLHFPTRPDRLSRLVEHGLEAVSLDSIVDDDGGRLVENARAVAWNGVEAAFDELEQSFPGFRRPKRRPIRATILGAGLVGKHAVEAATKYGCIERSAQQASLGCLGVEVVTVGRNLTHNEAYMRRRLRRTDLLVDASQRDDPTRALIPNAWLAWLPRHAVICDLVVDPYLLRDSPPTVRSIEGIPQGDLNGWSFRPDDPVWETQVPPEVPKGERRTVVSCYSWPGVYPRPCMERYGRQLARLLPVLLARGGAAGLQSDGSDEERALYQASLAAWTGGIRALRTVA